MMLMKRCRAWVVSVLGILMTLLIWGTPAWAADHLEAPFVRQNPQFDINDVYIFHPGEPQDLSRTVVALTVNPAAGVMSPSVFSDSVVYDLLIDQDGDAQEDLILRSVFSDPMNGQQATLLLVQEGTVDVLATGTTNTNITGVNTIRYFAGITDDPFVFDVNGFNDGLAFCFGTQGTDFFSGLNTLTIAIEVPSSFLGSGQIGVWGVTRA